MEKKKIALIIDSRGWAFDNIAHRIKENLPEYQIDIIPGKIFEGNMLKLFCILFINSCASLKIWLSLLSTFSIVALFIKPSSS